MQVPERVATVVGSTGSPSGGSVSAADGGENQRDDLTAHRPSAECHEGGAAAGEGRGGKVEGRWRREGFCGGKNKVKGGEGKGIEGETDGSRWRGTVASRVFIIFICLLFFYIKMPKKLKCKNETLYNIT